MNAIDEPVYEHLHRDAKDHIGDADELLDLVDQGAVSEYSKPLYVARAQAHATVALALLQLELAERSRPVGIQFTNPGPLSDKQQAIIEANLRRMARSEGFDLVEPAAPLAPDADGSHPMQGPVDVGPMRSGWGQR